MSSVQGSNSCQQLLAQAPLLFEGKEGAAILFSFLPAGAPDTDAVGYQQWGGGGGVCLYHSVSRTPQPPGRSSSPRWWGTNAPSDITGSGSHSFLFRGGLFLRWRLGGLSMSRCCSYDLMIRSLSLETALRGLTLCVFVPVLLLLLIFFLLQQWHWQWFI